MIADSLHIHTDQPEAHTVDGGNLKVEQEDGGLNIV